MELDSRLESKCINKKLDAKIIKTIIDIASKKFTGNTFKISIYKTLLQSEDQELIDLAESLINEVLEKIQESLGD